MGTLDDDSALEQLEALERRKRLVRKTPIDELVPALLEEVRFLQRELARSDRRRERELHDLHMQVSHDRRDLRCIVDARVREVMLKAFAAEDD